VSIELCPDWSIILKMDAPLTAAEVTPIAASKPARLVYSLTMLATDRQVNREAATVPGLLIGRNRVAPAPQQPAQAASQRPSMRECAHFRAIVSRAVQWMQ
jgi:hypothetical protein